MQDVAHPVDALEQGHVDAIDARHGLQIAGGMPDESLCGGEVGVNGPRRRKSLDGPDEPLDLRGQFFDAVCGSVVFGQGWSPHRAFFKAASDSTAGACAPSWRGKAGRVCNWAGDGYIPPHLVPR